VVVVQGAGVLGRIGLADLGLTMSFFGVGQVAGLLTGRWQSVLEAQRTRAARLATAALVLLAAGAALLPGWAAWAQTTEVPPAELGGGDVQVTLRWSSLVDLDLSVTDPAGDTVSYSNRSIPSGGQIDRDANFPCDTATSNPVENVFWPPGEAPHGAYHIAVTYQYGCGTDPGERYDLTVLFGGGVAERVEAAIDPGQTIAIDLTYEGGVGRGGSGELTAAEGTGAAMVGLGGTVLLMGTALLESGNSVASLAGAWKGGGLRGLRDLVSGGPGFPSGGIAWRDAAAELSGGRAAAALQRLPADLRAGAREAVLARLEEEQVDRLADMVQGTAHGGGAGADPGAVLASGGKGSGLLEKVPAEVRPRVEAKLLEGIREARLQGAVEAAAGGEGLGPGVDLDFEADLAGAVRRSGRVGSLWAGLPEEMKDEAERRLLERLEGERLSRWVEKLRGVAASVVEKPGGSVFDGAEVRHLLSSLPAGLREKVQEQASEVLERELVQDLVARAKQAIQRDQAVKLLRDAFKAGDGDAAGAVMEAVGTALDSPGEAAMEALVREATGGGLDVLRSLPRSGTPLPVADLTGHLAGEVDLLAAVRPTPGVEQALGGGGIGLRPQVEGALVEALDAARIEQAVEQAARALGPAGSAAADVMSAVRDVPGTRNLFAGLAEEARARAYPLLGERLRARREEEVARAVVLDRAEAALRAAMEAGDPAAADRALEGLSVEEARTVTAAALGEG
jgi:hypothetical protein